MTLKLITILIIAMTSCACATPERGVYMLPEGEVLECAEAIDEPALGCVTLLGCGENNTQLPCWSGTRRLK